MRPPNTGSHGVAATVIGVVLVASAIAWAAAAPDAGARKIEIMTRPVPLNRAAPEQMRVGRRLAWRGGIEITFPNTRMGGLSGLLVSADGRELIAVADEGSWLAAAISYDADGFLTGLSDGWTGPLRDTAGRPLKGKSEQDAEAMARMADGSILVAFERQHRLWRYAAGEAPLRGPAVPVPAPAGFVKLPKNNGIEALVTLTDNSLLAVAEGKGEARGQVFLRRDGAWAQLRYRRLGSYRPTGAARLPDGDLLILERRFSWSEGLGLRLVRLPAAAVVAGAELHPLEVARLAPPLSIDNMEAIDIRRSEDGEILVYLLSDDNFNPAQRTLLLMFAYQERP